MFDDLSARLQCLAQAVPEGARVVDVGCDHAFLIIALVNAGRVQYAVGTDVAEGPHASAHTNVREAGLTDQISVRRGDGLATIVPGEVNTAIIAGMGGFVMANILRNAEDVVGKLRRVILQPMNAAHQVRRYLYESGFVLVDEQICEDDGRLYEVIVADKTTVGEPHQAARSDHAYDPFLKDAQSFEFALAFGPLALTRMRPYFVTWLERAVGHWRDILVQMSASEAKESAARRASLYARIERAEASLASKDHAGVSGGNAQ